MQMTVFQELVCITLDCERFVARVQAVEEDAPAEEAAGAAAAAGEPVLDDAEAAPAAEEPQVDAMEEDDSGDEDWETMDLDAIKLPSQAAPEQVLGSHDCRECLAGPFVLSSASLSGVMKLLIALGIAGRC